MQKHIIETESWLNPGFFFIWGSLGVESQGEMQLTVATQTRLALEIDPFVDGAAADHLGKVVRALAHFVGADDVLVVHLEIQLVVLGALVQRECKGLLSKTRVRRPFFPPFS